MAEYCSQCSPFEKYDLNLFNIALRLKRGHSQIFLCEGCSNRGVYKDEQGLVYLIPHEKGEYVHVPIKVEELIK